jgi:hypothetical protein
VWFTGVFDDSDYSSDLVRTSFCGDAFDPNSAVQPEVLVVAKSILVDPIIVP